jgi:DNA repair protein RecN (Recombination protein N)
MLAAIAGMGATLREAELLQLVDDRHHRAGVDQGPIDELLLGQAGMRVDQGQEAEVGRSQAERPERRRKQMGCALAIPGQQEAGGAGQRLGRRDVEAHPERSYVLCRTNNPELVLILDQLSRGANRPQGEQNPSLTAASKSAVLHELRIENLLLIERAELRFAGGLNAITGETGAGKTILAHSLDLLMGGRARPQIVRPGADEAYVEGVFALPRDLLADPELAQLRARLPEAAEEIVLGRRIASSGRTSAFVQGRSASAGDLRALCPRLLAFYGQHEHRRLVLASAQLEILDGSAGAAHLERRDRYRDVHTQVAALSLELAELGEREGARERDLDLLRYELAEIEAAAPDPEEERELEADRDRLRHAEGLRVAAAAALSAIAGAEDDLGGARGMLGGAEAGLAAVDGVDPALDAIAERARAVTVELDDAASALRSYLEAIEAEPGRLEAIEERLQAIDRLKRKHGGSVETVLAHGEHCRSEIARLENAEELAEDLERRLAEASTGRAALAAELCEGRQKSARKLETRVAAELAELAMDGASLEVSLDPHPEGFGPNGSETVELRVSTNPGIPPSPLRDAASGGELSRIMLALTGLGPRAGAGTLVFDEIDAGIGGNTARATGERLRRLGSDRQVICITHLPQVASLAEAHFRIEKRARGGQAKATVDRVDGDELVAEIVRMLGAERDDETASRHARELLAAA